MSSPSFEVSSDEILDNGIIDCLVRLQSLLDHHRASIKLQDDILRVLFEGLSPSKGKKSTNNSSKPCLASLLIQKSRDWDGCLNGREIPSSFSKMLKLYKDRGMVPAQEWKLCIGDTSVSHVPEVMHPSLEDSDNVEGLKCICSSPSPSSLLKRDCEVCCERCRLCNKPRKHMIQFHYISLIEQIKTLCSSEAYCHDFLGMWRAKSRWLGKVVHEQPEFIHEFWDGEKMRMYQEFWNPDACWEAPIICSNDSCRLPYRAFPTNLRSPELHSAWNAELQEYKLRCSKCRQLIRSKKHFVKGDPRNFALMLHWDGFQAASTTIKDSAVVEVVILNGGKNSIIGSLPLVFLPLSHKDFENKHGDILGSFLQPLLCELQSSFVDGFEVNYAYSADAIHGNVQGGLVQLRTMLMLCTGDHPAQCKLGQVKDGGMSFCRRHKAHATLVKDAHGGRYVYDKNRYQGRYPPEERRVQEMWDAIRESKRLTKEQKEDVLRCAGLSGESILWSLFHLYGFDISKDLVYDVMHILSLNLFQKYIRKMMSTASTSLKKKIDQIVKEVAKAIPKTILNSGRWPYNPSKHFKMFKAEECQKFIQWCLPSILNLKEELSEPDIHIGLLLIDIAHMFFECTRKKGWTQNDIHVCRTLLLSWRILSEEYYGPNSSSLEHVAGSGEMFEDILRHGSHDSYWCFFFERCVSGYLAIPTNNKSNEVSYTRFHSRLLFTRLWQQLNLEDGMGAYGIELNFIHSCLVIPEGHASSLQYKAECYDWHGRGIFHVTSEKQAHEIWDACHRLPPCACKFLKDQKGVLVGSKRRQPFLLDSFEKDSLLDIYKELQGDHYLTGTLEVIGYQYAKIFLNQDRYMVGDLVVFKDSMQRGRLKKIFSHAQGGEISIFGVVECLLHECNEVDFITGMPLIPISDITNCIDMIKPISSISHKFFWMDAQVCNTKIAYDVSGSIVRSRLIHPGRPGCVPPWVEPGDVVLAFQEDMGFKEAIVINVDINHKRALISWVGMQQRSIWVDWKCIKSLLPTANCHFQRTITP